MSRKFITGVLLVAATITALSTAPARADNKELKRFIGTAATLYLLGKAIEQADAKGIVVQSHQYGWQHSGRPAWHGHGHHGKAKPHYSRKPPLPRACLIRVNKPWTTYAVGAACMRNNYRAFHRLPQKCTMKLPGSHKRYGYAVRCLRQNGFEIARR